MVCEQGLAGERQGAGALIVPVEVSQAPRTFRAEGFHIYIRFHPLPGMWRKFLIYGPSSFSSYSIRKSAIG